MLKWTWPSYWSAVVYDGELSPGEWNQWQAMEQAIAAISPREPEHQLLGHSRLVQDDAPKECYRAMHQPQRHQNESLPDFARRLGGGEAGKWRLLLQLDSQRDGEPNGWMWGDVGMIYFCLHRDDLTARHFDQVWLQLQCG